MPSPQVEAFDVTSGTNFDRQLGFMARSISVDNRTNQYMFLPGARRWIDPGIGTSMQISGTQKAQVEWGAPPGRTAPPVVSTERAQVVFYEDPNPPGGTGVAVAGSGITLLKTTVIGAGQFLKELGPVTPPSGTRALVIAPRDASAVPQLRFLLGVQTGMTYGPFVPVRTIAPAIWSTTYPLYYPIDLALDSSFSILVDVPGGVATTFDVYAVTDPSQVTTVRQNPTDILQVDITSAVNYITGGFPVSIKGNSLSEGIPVVQSTGAGNAAEPAAADRVTIFTSTSRAIGTYVNWASGHPATIKGAVLYDQQSGGGAGTATWSIGLYDGTNQIYILSSAARGTGTNGATRVYPGIAAVANVSGNDTCGRWPVFRLVVAAAALTTVGIVDSML